MYSTPVGRAIVWLKRTAISVARIADALDRAYPPPRTTPRRMAEFSVASHEDLERGYAQSRFTTEDEGL